MIKITVTVGGKPIEMTVEEAVALYDKLAALLDRRGLTVPYMRPQPVFAPVQPPPYWTFNPTCDCKAGG